MGITELSRIVHQLSAARIKQYIAEREPAGIADVWEILADCGWDRASLFDPQDIKTLLERLDELSVPYEREENGVITLSHFNIVKYKEKIRHLPAGKALLDLVPQDRLPS